MEVLSADIDLVDFEDNTFLVGRKDNYSSIKRSIEELGLLNPPILRTNKGKYQIISGWKRILSCKELKVKNLLCKVYEPEELSVRDCIKVVFYENKNNLSDLELAELIKLFKGLCFLEDKEIIKDILPLLGIASNRKHLDKYLNLESLDEVIKNAFYDEDITIEQCQMLSEISHANQMPMLKNLLMKYKLNNNESRQLIQIVEEISLRDSKSVPEILSLTENAVDNDKKDKNELKSKLRTIRYPDLSGVEEKYRKAVGDLNLPNDVNIFVNQFFEGNDIEFRIKVKSSEELSKISSQLQSLCEKGHIERLISLIRKGK